jgi:hypothetical protein
MSYTRGILSGSTNGKPIVVTATSSPGTTIHTAVSGTSSFDEVYFWATNVTSSAVTLTVEWGGTGDANDSVKAYTIPAYSYPTQVMTGQCLQNSLVVRAFASAANAINVTGYVNTIS